MSTRYLLALVIAQGAFATSAGALAVYQTGFEAPAYSIGQLVPQQGWTADGPPAAATVQNGIVKTGAQAAKINGASITSVGSNWYFDSVNYTIPVATLPILIVEWDMYVSSSSLPASYGIDVYMEDEAPAFLRRAAAVTVDRFNTVRVWDGYQAFGAGALIATFATVTRDAWHHYRMVMDYGVGEWELYIDGGLVQSGLGISPSSTLLLLDADLWTVSPTGGANDAAYYDNFSIENLAAIPSCVAGDTNCDTVHNAADIPSFVNLLLGTGAACDACSGDLNGDMAVNGLDIPLFVAGI